MLSYTKYLLAILLLINLYSCKPKPVIQKEIVYTNYSLKQLKKYLEGTWVIIDTATNDTVKRPFNFTYAPKSDTIGYMNYVSGIGEHHVTFFTLRKDQDDYSIQFTPYMPSPNRKFYKIRKISNLEFVVEGNNRVVVYKKAIRKLK